MINNIILIILIIILFFFISNENKIDNLFSKKYIKYLLVLLIILFVYQNYNLGLLIGVILILMFLNVDMKTKFNKNNLSYENFKDLLTEYFISFKEKFTNQYEVKPFQENKGMDLINILNESDESKKQKVEPFKTEVANLREMYDNIKLELKKING
jgi:hypothetical protein